MSRNSKVILAKNIKMDKNFKSVLKITESEMVSLMTSQDNLVFTGSNFSFLRDGRNGIQIKASYSSCIQANYIAFQNPSYSNKWFFAFIDEVKYISEGVTEIVYTIDTFTTWWEYWSPKACFTIREHVTNDTIGLHTVPEGLETGEFLSSDDSFFIYSAGLGYTVCVGVAMDLIVPFSALIYNGIYSGISYIALEDARSLANFLRWYDSQGATDEIVCLFMIPIAFISNTPIPSWGSKTVTIDGANYTFRYLEVPTSDIEYNLGTKTVVRPSQLGIGNNKYTPRNKKLLTSDYMYLLVDNMCGNVAKYDYEYFNDPSNCVFQCYGSITPGCSIKTYPKNYKGIENNYSEGITSAKLPICGWNSDVYTNWLTQNGVNIDLSLLGSGLQILGGIGLSATGVGSFAGASNITSGFMGIANTLAEIRSHSLAPRQAQGNTNIGDIMFSIGNVTPTFYKMTIKKEFAEIIDRYFDRMGYKVNIVKVPNMAYRENYNYVQIASEDNVAYPNNHNNIGIPASALNEINNMFRNGITLWNNHTNFGDYSVSNNITN